MRSLLSLRTLFTVLLLATSALIASAGGPLCWEGREGTQAAEGPPAADATQERERLLALGRELFLERCGSCHDADGSKPMADGPPLNQRNVSEEKVSRVVDSRFKQATEEQRRAVKLHINSFMKR
ncbi:MAG: cytochrome c [Acidobacteria bacterium]|nr:cytochrome c [Acidobacteriota bacterium]